MEPQIRYAHTSDGVSIAYWVVGEGPPLINIPPLAHHVQLDWRLPPLRALYEWLARRHQLMRFDFRGRGMSQRDGFEYSHETELLDLEAVVTQLGWDSFSIFTGGTGTGPSVRYAARHPERLRHLIIEDGFAPTMRDIDSRYIRALSALLPIDYEIYTEVMAQMVWGWQGGDLTRQYAGLLRASSTQEHALRSNGFTAEAIEDFARSLPLITTPTLLVFHSGAEIVGGADAAQRLAAAIPARASCCSKETPSAAPTPTR
jgi:pimeloyl-ACP methyl ester carboxylesterase